MGHIPHLDEFVAIAAIGVVVTLLLARFRLPAVTGLLLAGVLCGPYGLGVVKSVEAISALAELGVVLLLFTIGLEFSLARLRDIFRRVALGGVLQVGLTTAAVFGASKAFGLSSGRALFFGMVLALSSTAIVLRGLAERRELDAPHGRFIVGTLIFQDLCVVPMVLIVPLLGSGGGAGWKLMALALLKATGVVVGTLVFARFIIPRAFTWVDRARSREVFLLAILGLSLGAALLTSLAGLSMALGAFLGGMVVADTEYGHRAMSDLAPLRDAFVSVFFVSLGMLFDVQVLLASPLLLLSLTAALILGKGVLATVSALVMRFPARAAWLVGVGLAQFGEFGFVLAQLGRQSGVVDAEALSPVLSAGVLTMVLTPLMVRVAPHVRAGERILAPLARRLGARGIDDAPASLDELSGHVVVVGYGVAGRVVAKALEDCGVKVVVLELNADTVRAGRAEGMSIYYGDATSEEALAHAHLPTARALVLVMNDPSAARRVLDTAKRVAPRVPVMLRTHYLTEVAELGALGASDVVVEEVESAVEILARVLRWLDVSRNVIDKQVRVSRERTQASERKPTVPRKTLGELPALADLKLEHVLLEAGSPAVGQGLRALELRGRTGALVVALQRAGQLLEELDPEQPLAVGDVVYLAGRGESVRAAVSALSAPERPASSG